jgi:hypothetical protein
VLRVRPVHGALAVCALGALLASGCGGGGSSESAATTARTTTTAARGVTVVSAKLTPDEAIPKGPDGAEGSATITLNMRSGKACWELTVSGIDKPLSAHVHEGLSGKLGDVVIPLGDTFSRKGCVLSGRRALHAVAVDPESYYVDVHTTKYIQGAVRGQLRAAPA